jgi:hypothetical protein
LPEALCDSVEDLVDAYRYMDRTDYGCTLVDIHKLHGHWDSMRKDMKAYKYIALSFDLHARERIEPLHHALTLAPQKVSRASDIQCEAEQEAGDDGKALLKVS